jgi:hypothetical protein
MAHGGLARRVDRALMGMGIPLDEFQDVSATRYRGRNSSKEADSAFRPKSFQPNKTDWPTTVIETGFSESPSHLRFDARWWLTESRGDVKIAIIIKRAQSKLRIEK